VNFALEASGIFLFLAGLMYLSLTGRLGDMFRDRAVGQLLLVTLVSGLAVYHWGGILWDLANQPDAVPEPSASIPAPPPPAPAPHRPAKLASRPAPPQVEEPAPIPPPEAPQTIIVREAPPTEVLAPPVVVPTSSGPDPYESKAKRGIRAVGRFLHLAKKTNP
jgi:hypothetical protein